MAQAHRAVLAAASLACLLGACVQPTNSAPEHDADAAVATESGATIWRFDSRSSNSGLVVDGSGNIFFGGTRFSATTDATNLILSRYSPDGQELWTRTFTSTKLSWIVQLALGPDGTVGVGGFFEGTVDFGGQQRTDQGMGDAFVAFYTPGGDLKSVTTFGGLAFDNVAAVAADPSGDWFIGGQALGITIAGTALDGPFVARLDPQGVPRWARAGGGFATVVSGSSIYAGSPGLPPQISRLRAADGVADWSDTLGDSVRVFRAALDGSGQRLVIGGDFQGSLTLNGRTFTGAGLEDVFIAGLDSATGKVLWGEQLLGSQGSDQTTAVCADASGHAYVGGSYSGSVPPRLGEPGSSSQAFVAKYTLDGTRVWLHFVPDGNTVSSLYCDSPRGILVGFTGGFLRMVP